MKILLNSTDLKKELKKQHGLGFVPTMGSLHKGHISLIKKSLNKCSKTIVSIFVNPTQFNSKRDYLKYPRNNKKDLLILKKLNVDFVFIPHQREIYNIRNKTNYRINKKDKIMCAIHRKGHFEGVINVMDRLTKMIKPKNIFMGEKDYQQLFLVKKYIEKKYKSKIIKCKTIRDKKKLALSSRNLLLKKKELNKARKIANNLFLFKKKITKMNNVKKLLHLKKLELIKLYNISIDYLELRKSSNLKISNNFKSSKLFVAYNINNIRLIDNF